MENKHKTNVEIIEGLNFVVDEDLVVFTRLELAALIRYLRKTRRPLLDI